MYHVHSSRTTRTTRQYQWEINAMPVSLDDIRRDKWSSFSGLLCSCGCDAWSLNVIYGQCKICRSWGHEDILLTIGFDRGPWLLTSSRLASHPQTWARNSNLPRNLKLLSTFLAEECDSRTLLKWGWQAWRFYSGRSSLLYLSVKLLWFLDISCLSSVPEDTWRIRRGILRKWEEGRFMTHLFQSVTHNYSTTWPRMTYTAVTQVYK